MGQSFYLNLSTESTISKQKVHKLDFKKWETVLRDFNDHSFPSSGKIDKKLNLCRSNGVLNKIFFESEDKSLKRTSISDKNFPDFSTLNSQPNVLYSISIDQSPQKEKSVCPLRNSNFGTFDIQTSFEKNAFRHVSKNVLKPRYKRFSENMHSSLRRKSMRGRNIVEIDFSPVSSQSEKHFRCYSGQTPQNEILENTHFNIQTLFESSIKRCDNVPEQDKCKMLVKKVKNSILKDYFSPLPEEFSKNSLILKNINTVENVANTDGGVKHKPAGQWLLEKPTSNCNIPKNFCQNNIERLLPINGCTLEPFENSSARSFKKVKHAPINADLQEISKNLLKNNSIESNNVGSEWVHSLQQSIADQPYLEEKKKISNVLVGSFCEQILKFERRELSERAIGEHENESKNTSEYLLVNSIIHESYEIVAAKCDLNNAEEKWVAFFQKSSFAKQQMKTGKFFLLTQPWHLIQMKAFMCPVLICKFFKSAKFGQNQQQFKINERSKEIANQHSEKQIQYFENCSSGAFEEENKWKKHLCLSSRIQRIWINRISVKKLGSQSIYRLTVLLQVDNGDFYLLSTSSCHNPHFLDWLKLVNGEEGQFYFFENLRISHRLEQKRFPKLFKYLQYLLKDNKMTVMKQDFIYQLGIDGMTKKPSKILEDLPPFLTLTYQPLSVAMKKENGARISCLRAKALVQYRSVLYVSDESLFHSERLYVRVFLPESAASFSNSTINIKEAFILEGALHLDEYSQISTSLNDGIPIHLKDIDLPLRQDSNVADIVFVEGNISGIDENNACIWLQCNFCGNENLVQNTDEVVFCADCCLVVNNPLLQVKMNVTIICGETFLNVKLMSSTIKRILSLEENSYQPQRNLSDVLGKRIGPLLCYIRGKEITDCHKIFHLQEIQEILEPDPTKCSI